MPKPHVLQLCSYPSTDQTALDAAYQMHTTADLPQIGPQITAIATSGGQGASAEIITACPNLELIAIYGVGYDAIPLDLCRARNIAVTNTPDVLTDDCADLAVGMTLALCRNIAQADAHVRSGAWSQSAFPLQRRLTGARVGILGLGRIGQAIAKRLAAFDADIAYTARSAKACPYRFIASATELAAQSDILIVASAATAETRHIVNAETLRALGPNGLLINISRAANIDEDALLTALETHKIAGAALDVFEGEPALNPRFLALDNVLLQPHHASATHQTRAAMGDLMRANLAAYFAGQPLLTPVLPPLLPRAPLTPN